MVFVNNNNNHNIFSSCKLGPSFTLCSDDRLRQKPWSPRSLMIVWQHVNLSDVSLEIRPRYSLVADEDVKKPNKETNKYPLCSDRCYRGLVMRDSVSGLSFSPFSLVSYIRLSDRRVPCGPANHTGFISMHRFFPL